MLGESNVKIANFRSRTEAAVEGDHSKNEVEIEGGECKCESEIKGIVDVRTVRR